MRVYADWFLKTHLIPHFEMEEKHIFSILETDNKPIKRALSDHRRLKRLFAKTNDNAKLLSITEEVLEQHIRFEVRVLFPEIQKIAAEEQMLQIQILHQSEIFMDKEDDMFWK